VLNTGVQFGYKSVPLIERQRAPQRGDGPRGDQYESMEIKELLETWLD
jgi:hypothetical protein